MIRLVPPLVALAIVVPVLAGLAGTLAAAFGHLPALGFTGPSLDPWRDLAALPGLGRSLWLSLATGLGATALALLAAMAAAAALWPRLSSGAAARALAPLLAAPHAAMAVGLAFLLAPSGWLARLASPWATGWQRPPDLATVNDPAGLALAAGLIVKELPFLLFVLIAALRQLPVAQSMAEGRALGYRPAAVWACLILPQAYRLIRLPVFVTLAFAVSVVDMAILLGPATPPPMAVAVMRWMVAPDPAGMLPAAAGAVAMLGLTALAALAWLAGERLLGLAVRARQLAGRRRGPRATLAAGAALAGLAWLGGIAALAVLALWSVAGRWRFPDPLPASFGAEAWTQPAAGWGDPALATLGIGAAVTLAALALAIGWLEAEDRGALPRARWIVALVVLPLLLPQVGFLYGLTASALALGLPGGAAAVIWAQLLFAFPYVLIALSGPWRGLDPRLPATAAALGAGPWRRLFTVKLPVLAGPLMAAAAIGFAVSVAQYLPTLLLGAGRVATLTTEAVTLATGVDRRLAAVTAVLQAVLPMLGFALALWLPGRLFANRRGLIGRGAA